MVLREYFGGKHRFKEYICPSCRESGNKLAVSLDAGIPAAADPFSMASSSRPVAVPSTASSSSDKPSAVVAPRKATPKMASASKRKCPECKHNKFKHEWCNDDHFVANTGWCKQCGGVCTGPCGQVKLKSAFEISHRNNCRWYNRNLLCAECSRAKNEEVHICGNDQCTFGEKQCRFRGSKKDFNATS